MRIGSHNRSTMNAAPGASTGNRTVAASSQEPFEMLYACHDRVRSSLALLARLVAHLRVQGHSNQARRAACDVMRFFDVDAPHHHQDEERHVFPRLEASDEPQLAALAKRLRSDHCQIEAQWCVLWPLLEQVACGRGVAPDELEAPPQRFAHLHSEHLAAEEQIAFPSAHIATLCEGPNALRAMGEEMACRRGVRPAT